MARNSTPRLEKGFSLVEALLVLGLLGVVTLVTIPAMYRFFQRHRIQTAAEQMAVQLRFARNAAVTQRVRFQVVFHNETATSPNIPNTYQVLHESGGTFVPYKRADVSIPPSLTIVSGGLGTVQFDARGSAVPSGNVTVRGTDSSEYQISVSTAGGVRLTQTNQGI